MDYIIKNNKEIDWCLVDKHYNFNEGYFYNDVTSIADLLDIKLNALEKKVFSCFDIIFNYCNYYRCNYFDFDYTYSDIQGENEKPKYLRIHKKFNKIMYKFMNYIHENYTIEEEF